MKRALKLTSLFCFTMSLFLSQASAIETGFYGGVDVGIARSDFSQRDFVRLLIDEDVAKDYPLFDATLRGFFDGVDSNIVPDDLAESVLFDLLEDPDNNGYAFRLYVGYIWKKFLGVELAGFINSDVEVRTVNAPDGAFLSSIGLPQDLGAVGLHDDSLCKTSASPCFKFNAEAQTRGMEILGKVNLPLEPFMVYAKGGVAYTVLDVEGRLQLINLPSPIPSVVEAKVKNDMYDLRPVYVAGIAYRASSELIVDLAYHHYEKSGYQPRLDMYLFSITIEFSGTNTCGDVLC